MYSWRLLIHFGPFSSVCTFYAVDLVLYGQFSVENMFCMVKSSIENMFCMYSWRLLVLFGKFSTKCTFCAVDLVLYGQNLCREYVLHNQISLGYKVVLWR